MALPGNLSTRTVEGWFVDFEGNAIAGQISFSLPETLTDSSAGTFIVESAEIATLDSNGQFSVTIPVTNDADISPASYQYTVNELFTGGRTYTISLPSGATVDIATLAPTGTYTAFYPLAAAYLWNATVTRLGVQEGLYNDTTNSLVPPNDSFETGIGGWIAPTNCSIARVNTVAHAGSWSLRMTSTASGRMDAGTATGTGGIPVVAGMNFTANAYFRAATVARNINIYIYWYNSAGTNLSNSASTGTVSDTTSGWTLRTVTATAPTNAAFAQVRTSVVTGGASEQHYVDSVSLLAAGYVATPSGYTGNLPINEGTFTAINPVAATNATNAINSNTGAQASLTAAQQYESNDLGYPMPLMLMGV